MSSSVAYAVTLKAKEPREFFNKAQKIRILLAPLVKILGHVSEKCPNNHREIQYADDEACNALQEEIDDDKNEAKNDLKVVKRVNAVAPLHKLPHTLAEWSSVFHNIPPSEYAGDDKKCRPHG